MCPGLRRRSRRPALNGMFSLVAAAGVVTVHSPILLPLLLLIALPRGWSAMQVALLIDLGRVCEPGSVEVVDVMSIERYSHVMHIVTGRVAAGRTAFDVLTACFPAGTLAGGPKPRAMPIIDELEPSRRGLYGGCVGYLDFAGDSDTAIAIRTALMRGGTAYVQAGAGAVADSDPVAEDKSAAAKRPPSSARCIQPTGLPHSAVQPVKAAVPFGTPRPVGPSYPVVPVHRYEPEQVPFEPLVTSYSAEVWAYGNDAGYEPEDGAPASA
jgi:hypothetical protein